MNNQALQLFANLLTKLTAVLVTLSSLLSSPPVATPAQGHHFGTGVPNVVATTTTPATLTNTVPYFSSFDGATYVIATSSISFNNGNATSVAIGNNTSFNGVNLWVIASSTFIAGSTSGTVLTGIGTAGSATSTIIGITQGIPTNGLQVGDPCFASSNVTSSFILVYGCEVTSVATTTASTTVTYMNASSSVTVPTSTITRIEIHHFPF